MSLIVERRTLLGTVLVGASVLAVARPLLAQPVTHEVLMLNRDPENPSMTMVYDPLIVVAQPGDTVRFVSVDRGHNAVSVNGMIPEGAEPWSSPLNEDFEVTLTVPGIYGYYCLPHQAMGMVGLIIVEGEGYLDNLEAAQSVRHRGRSAQNWEQIWSEAEAAGYLGGG